MRSVDDLQHLAIKVFAREDATLSPVKLRSAIDVFHRWIRDGVGEDLLIDVADYRHVHHGPLVMLVAHEANYILDDAEGRLGLLYVRKAPVAGSPQQRVRQGLQTAAKTCALLEQEDSLEPLRFSAGEIAIMVNDRALGPNSDATERLLTPLVTDALSALWNTSDFALQRIGEPRDRFCLAGKTKRPLAVAELAI